VRAQDRRVAAAVDAQLARIVATAAEHDAALGTLRWAMKRYGFTEAELPKAFPPKRT
jgi:hypothetical protein